MITGARAPLEAMDARLESLLGCGALPSRDERWFSIDGFRDALGYQAKTVSLLPATERVTEQT